MRGQRGRHTPCVLIISLSLSGSRNLARMVKWLRFSLWVCMTNLREVPGSNPGSGLLFAAVAPKLSLGRRVHLKRSLFAACQRPACAGTLEHGSLAERLVRAWSTELATRGPTAVALVSAEAQSRCARSEAEVRVPVVRFIQPEPGGCGELAVPEPCARQGLPPE